MLLFFIDIVVVERKLKKRNTLHTMITEYESNVETRR